MHAEQFVLIPKQMYTREHPHISQLLSNKNFHNPAKQISLLQRNKSPSVPSASQQDTEQKTDVSMDDKSTISESMEKSFMTDNTSAITQGVLNDIRILKGITIQRANKILEIIEESDSVFLDSSKILLIRASNTDVLVATFLYSKPLVNYLSNNSVCYHFSILVHI